MDPERGLKADTILIEEYRFAANTANQALQSQDQTLNLFLLSAVALVSGIGALFQLSGSAHTVVQPLSVALFAAGGLACTTLFVRLVRLNRTRRECIVAMDQIKEFYIAETQSDVPGLRKAFRWRWEQTASSRHSISPGLSPSSLLMLAGSLSFAGAVYIATLLSGVDSLPIATSLSPQLLALAPSVLVGATIVLIDLGYAHNVLKLSADSTDPIGVLAAREAQVLGRGFTEGTELGIGHIIGRDAGAVGGAVDGVVGGVTGEMPNSEG